MQHLCWYCCSHVLRTARRPWREGGQLPPQAVTVFCENLSKQLVHTNSERSLLHSAPNRSGACAVQMCPEGLAGIEIKVDGFSHKLPLLVNFIFKQLVDLKVDPARFERLREGLLRRYKNANMKPDKHATYLRIYAIKKTLWPVEAVQEQIEAVTPADLQGDAHSMSLF